MIVAHNLNALSTIRSLNINNSSMSGSLERLATGYRINTGADDPAGLVISEQLRAQNAGLARAVQNSQEADNMLGIAEGALSEMSNILKKMKQLAVHASNNGVTSPEQVAADQAEIDSSVQTIDRIARTTKYSDQFLLNGNKAIGYDSQTGINSTADYPLLDSEMSELYQIPSFNKNIQISFNGTDGTGDAEVSAEARKAYIELDGADNRLDITTNAEGLKVLSKDQSFSIRGSKGSRSFSFAAGTALGDINSTLNSAADSIGLESSLIFDSSQTVDMIAYTTTSVNTNLGVETDGNGGDIRIFNALLGVQNVNNTLTIGSDDQVTGFNIVATDVGNYDVRFDMVDSLGTTIGSNTVTLNPSGTASNTSQAVTVTSANGSNVTFNYVYGFGGPTVSATNDNHVQTGGSASTIGTVTQQNGVSNRSALVIDPADAGATPWTVTQNTTGANTIDFTLSDGSTSQTVTVNRPVVGGLTDDHINVAFNTLNGTTFDFDYNFELDTTNNAWDHIGDGTLFTFSNTGVFISETAAQTDGPSAGNVTSPTNPTVDAVQNISSTLAVGDGANTKYTINASAIPGNQVTFTVTDNNSVVVSTQTVTLANIAGPGATAGTTSQAISLNTLDGGTIDFDYFYDNNPNNSTCDIPEGDLFDLDLTAVPAYDRADGATPLFSFNNSGIITANNNIKTAGTYAPATSSTPVLTNATVVNNDRIGESWTLASIANPDYRTVTFELRDNSGQRVVTQNMIMTNNPPELNTASQAITLTTGTVNNTSITLDWGYENDPNANGGNGYFDHIGIATLAEYDNTGTRTYLNNTDWTNGPVGPAGLNVTSPSDQVPAVSHIISQVNIFDIVNGETPFTISAANGSSAGEIEFTIHGSTTDPLLTETVNLAAFPFAATGYQTINLETSNGSTIEFRYYYENDPTTGEYDKPVGDLFTVDATPVNSERLFNGLSKAALAAGALIDVNLDPATGTHVQNLEYGRNTDGQGRIFMKVIEHDTTTQHIEFELYKDAGFSESGLIGYGSGSSDGTAPITIAARNNSNLEGEITFDDAGGTIDFTQTQNLAADTYIGIGGIWGRNGVSFGSGFAVSADAIAGEFAIEETVFNGVELGKNTDSAGRIFYRTIQDGANSGQVFAYNNEAMREEDLVAMSYAGTDLSADTEVVLNSVNNSGLGIILRTGAIAWGGATGDRAIGETRFENIGLRVSADEYGSANGLTVKQSSGQCWEYYSDPADSTATIIEGNNDAYTVTGADAIVNINGTEKTCDGLTLDLATLDMTGKLVFKEGEVGATTVAQVGYSTGSIFSNAGFLTDAADGWTDSNGDGHRDPDEIDTFKAGGNLVNAGHNTTETLGAFSGGMQLQLGEGAGGQERTVLGIGSMTATELGKLRNADGAVIALNDLLAGSIASLAENPIEAMKIIDQAISDVADARARIGAWQSNLLETNINNLSVAIENITKTESYIRDADMAYESTQFTKNQIMVQAATSMTAAANSQSQQVLALLGA